MTNKHMGSGRSGRRTRYTSHMPEELAPTFKAKFEAELADAERKAPPGVMKVLLCDGVRALWNYAENTPLVDEYEKLIDYCHTLEHLSLADEALFGKGTNAAKAWYDKYRIKLLEEDLAPRSISHSMDYYEQTNRLPKRRRDALDMQRTFFHNNQAKMTYADFRRRGLPIGSGPVEAARKTLVKTRLCPASAGHALDPRRRTTHPRPENLRQVQSMGCLLE